jgi:hypothetical protein
MHRILRAMSSTTQFQFIKHSASSVSAGLAIVQTSIMQQRSSIGLCPEQFGYLRPTANKYHERRDQQ